MAGAPSSSEEFVDDDSAEGEEEEDASSASFESEYDDDLDNGGGVEASDSKEPSHKKPRIKPDTPARITSNDRKVTVSSGMKQAPSKVAKKAGAAVRKKGKARAGTTSCATTTGNQTNVISSQACSLIGDDTPASPDAMPGLTSDKLMPSPAGSSTSIVPCTPAAGAPASGNIEVHAATPAGSDPKGGNSRSGPTVKEGARTPKAAISDYMVKANRPYSVMNVFDNMHKKIPKAMVQKILDELVSDELVRLQEYGKSKIYYANQAKLPNGAGDVSDAKLARLDQESKESTEKFKIVAAQAREAQTRVHALASQPTDASLDEQLEVTTREVERLEARNASIKGQGHNDVSGGMKAMKAEFNKYRTLWLSRKRSAMDVIDMIAEGMEKKPQQVMESIGLEPDEESIPTKM